MITLCADDYGLYDEIDRAVLILADKQILHATSCMTTAPRWYVAAQSLRAWIGKIDIGLHLNLTEGFGQATASLPAIILRSYARLLNRRAVQTIFRTQFDAFTQALGCLPTMIDGHQHIHQLPLIREVLLETIEDFYKGRSPVWVRNTVPVSQSWVQKINFLNKPNLLRLLGGEALARRLKKQRIATNQGFAGVYGFDAADANRYGEYMKEWCVQAKHANSNVLIMCHPAVEAVMGDAISSAREIEFNYLVSPAFQALRTDMGIQLGMMRAD